MIHCKIEKKKFMPSLKYQLLEKFLPNLMNNKLLILLTFERVIAYITKLRIFPLTNKI